jgi:hypothetical protein
MRLLLLLPPPLLLLPLLLLLLLLVLLLLPSSWVLPPSHLQHRHAEIQCWCCDVHFLS